MERVDILFCNLQSHANTRFVIQPGVNFILAKGNNVGKSTIFRVLSTIASAPKNSSGKLNSLIRTGCAEAYAAFKFSGESVVARFVRRDREAPKLFFEHIHSDGQTTRSVACPPALLDALGIALGEDELPINFNDADSVQLVSEVSTAADGILTRVLLDSDVEHIKSNLYTLAREINVDSKQLTTAQHQAQAMLDRLSYTPAVEEFKQDEAKLSAAANLLDSLEPIKGLGVGTEVSQTELTKVEVALELLGILDGLRDVEPPVKMMGSRRISAAINFCSTVAQILDLPSAKLSGVPREVGAALSACSVIARAIRSLEEAEQSANRIKYCATERQQIAQQMNQNSRRVECPIKGEVWYTDEKCLPCGD